MGPLLSTLRRNFLAAPFLCLLLTPLAHAQENIPALPEDLGTLRLRYGRVFRQGHHTDRGPGLSYSGMTGDDLSLYGNAFPSRHFGFTFELARESLDIVDGETELKGNLLARGSLSLTARMMVGRVRIETGVGYGLSQLPSITETAQPRFLLAPRRSILLSGKGTVPLPAGFTGELRLETPLVLWAIDGRGRSLESWGWMGGLALGHGVAKTRQYAFGFWLEYQLNRDLAQTGTGRTQSQTVSRLGLTAGLTWLAKVRRSPL